MALLTTREAAEVVRLHPQTIRRAVKRNELNALAVGGRGDLRIDSDDLADWVVNYSRKRLEPDVSAVRGIPLIAARRVGGQRRSPRVSERGGRR